LTPNESICKIVHPWPAMDTMQERVDSIPWHVERKMVQPLVEDFPSSIYGVGMTAIVMSAVSRSVAVHGVTFFVIVLLCLNLALQICTLLAVNVYISNPAVREVRSLYRRFHEDVFVDGYFSQEHFDDFDNSEELCQLPLAHFTFAFLILILWTMTVLAEIIETVRLCLSWMYLENCNPKDVEFSNCEEWVSSIDQDDGNDIDLKLEAASCRVKCSIFVIILLPKLAIAFFLWWLGARWLIATTSLTDLILNCAALTFILNTDELVYETLVPLHIKRMSHTYKIVAYAEPGGQRGARIGFNLLKLSIRLLICLWMPYAYLRFFQQILPGYKFDVAAVCRSADLNT